MPDNSINRATKSLSADSPCCGSCQYWGDLTMQSVGAGRYCKNPRLQSVSSVGDFKLPTKDSAALVSDDNGFLQTGPEFGCNQWHEKKEATDPTAPTGINVVKMKITKHDLA